MDRMNNSIQTKYCPRCQLTKPLTDWYTRRQQETSSYCKICVNAHAIQRFRNAKKKAVEYLGGSCERCGYNKYHGALHLHHRDPAQKDPTFAGLLHRRWSKIEIELQKCELLCANCHAEEHSIHWATRLSLDQWRTHSPRAICPWVAKASHWSMHHKRLELFIPGWKPDVLSTNTNDA